MLYMIVETKEYQWTCMYKRQLASNIAYVAGEVHS